MRVSFSLWHNFLVFTTSQSKRTSHFYNLFSSSKKVFFSTKNEDCFVFLSSVYLGFQIYHFTCLFFVWEWSHDGDKLIVLMCVCGCSYEGRESLRE